mmetsp:Transcript_6951/g.42504  ORF Transcript_6951/g.42504 Transcript_6951/m.42504 type:complete len:87 (-) Transcript_6951:2395-2655(-)
MRSMMGSPPGDWVRGWKQSQELWLQWKQAWIGGDPPKKRRKVRLGLTVVSKELAVRNQKKKVLGGGPGQTVSQHRCIESLYVWSSR